MTKDPVCGMEVGHLDAAPSRTMEGQTFYFCSDACAAQFDAGPEAYRASTNVASPPPPDRQQLLPSDDEAHQREYRSLMRKFWFSASVSIPILLVGYPALPWL